MVAEETAVVELVAVWAVVVRVVAREAEAETAERADLAAATEAETAVVVSVVVLAVEARVAERVGVVV